MIPNIEIFSTVLLLALLGLSNTQDTNLSASTTENTYYFPPEFLQQMTLDSQSMMDVASMPAWLIGLIPKLKGPILRFYLFTSEDGCKQGKEIHTENIAELEASGFNKANKIIFLYHGWTETWNMWPWYFPLSTKNAYCRNGYDANIILVDFSRAVAYWTYAAFICLGLDDVVREGAQFMYWLIRYGVTVQELVHLIGLSLGGQMVGLIAESLKKDFGISLGRVTGIDPAGPCFDPYHGLTQLCPCKSASQISKEVAEYVDCYHTNAGGFGMYSACGHVDYWPNGGMLQCITEPLFSHVMSPVYWESSIPPTGWEMVPACTDGAVRTLDQYRTCDHQTDFGQNNNGITGQYYVCYPCWQLPPTFYSDVEMAT